MKNTPRLPVIGFGFVMLLSGILPKSWGVPPVDTSYVVVVARQTREQPEWQAVVDALVARHAATVLVYDQQPEECLPELQRRHPRYTCFVAPHEEVTRAFVAQVHQLTRQYDDDPYTDTFWGILTGWNAEGALRIAQHDEPLTVRKVASGTEFAMEKVVEGVWYCELVQNRMYRKEPGQTPQRQEAPDDTTRALVDTLNAYRADLFITSGHATERDWQIGFRYRNGSFRSSQGQLFGLDTRGERHPIDSPNPKVYLAVGNCLMGHIDGPDAMALAWLESAGVKQMVGYTVLTWFGFGGWGCLDYFLEQPGRYTLTEAFFANQHALIYNLEHEIGNPRGLEFDKNAVAFYGDPAWVARMAEGELHYEQQLDIADGVYTLTITPNRGEASFQPVNTNGSQRGWRPLVQFLPHRIGQVELLAGEELQPVITDDFILIPNPRDCDPDREYRVVFQAEPK